MNLKKAQRRHPSFGHSTPISTATLTPSTSVRTATGGTSFQRAVWRALRAIKPGTTKSYGQIAASIGRPTASRAVGAANGANPIAIVVPCHRVIGANGALTGYGGGLPRKRWLLDHERTSHKCRCCQSLSDRGGTRRSVS